MSNLAEIINQHSPAQAIDAMYEANYQPRTWLGLSQIGHKCPRWLWLKHHGKVGISPEGRALRLFELGNILEEAIIKDLRACGYEVTGQQDKAVISWGDLSINGSIDGVISGLIESSKTHLLEIKSSSAKRFTNLLKVGYEAWDDKYNLQIHAYMLAKKLERCLVVVYNKDNSELYTERIKLDKQWAINRIETVFRHIMAPSLPAGVCGDGECFDARFCDMRRECFP